MVVFKLGSKYAFGFIKGKSKYYDGTDMFWTYIPLWRKTLNILQREILFKL